MFYLQPFPSTPENLRFWRVLFDYLLCWALRFWRALLGCPMALMGSENSSPRTHQGNSDCAFRRPCGPISLPPAFRHFRLCCFPIMTNNMNRFWWGGNAYDSKGGSVDITFCVQSEHYYIKRACKKCTFTKSSKRTSLWRQSDLTRLLTRTEKDTISVVYCQKHIS